MDESLAALSDPRLDLASMLCEAVTAIRRYLYQPELPLPARLSGIASVVEELCPAPGPGGYALPFGAIPPGTRPAVLAAMTAELLRGHPSPATSLLERLSGETVRIKVAAEGTAPLDDSARRRLHARPGTMAYVRSGCLVTASGVTAASTCLTVIPALLPAEVRDGLGSDVPFGTLAAPFGLKRRARAATATGEDPAVRSTALLEVAGELAGIAAEWVTREFVEYVAAQSA